MLEIQLYIYRKNPSFFAPVFEKSFYFLHILVLFQDLYCEISTKSPPKAPSLLRANEKRKRFRLQVCRRFCCRKNSFALRFFRDPFYVSFYQKSVVFPLYDLLFRKKPYVSMPTRKKVHLSVFLTKRCTFSMEFYCGEEKEILSRYNLSVCISLINDLLTVKVEVLYLSFIIGLFCNILHCYSYESKFANMYSVWLLRLHA